MISILGTLLLIISFYLIISLAIIGLVMLVIHQHYKDNDL